MPGNLSLALSCIRPGHQRRSVAGIVRPQHTTRTRRVLCGGRFDEYGPVLFWSLSSLMFFFICTSKYIYLFYLFWIPRSCSGPCHLSFGTRACVTFLSTWISTLLSYHNSFDCRSSLGTHARAASSQGHITPKTTNVGGNRTHLQTIGKRRRAKTLLYRWTTGAIVADQLGSILFHI